MNMNNGRRYSIKVRIKAKNLRRKGQTHREIAKELGIALGTASLWTKGITLTDRQKQEIEKRRNRVSPNFSIEQRRIQAFKNLSRFWKPKPTNKELIQRIISFYRKHGRIPYKREFNNTYIEYKKNFGSWNNAIKIADFEPNPIRFSKRFQAKDGHICDSYAEKIIDDWLTKYKIAHEKNLKYGNTTKMTADFSCGNIRIEYFGLAGEVEGYDAVILKKRKICKEKNFKLIEIYPKDLFPNRLNKISGLTKLKNKKIKSSR